ncbi:MAG: MBL fold metallo-hydrolase [Pseudomonadota bacterium]
MTDLRLDRRRLLHAAAGAGLVSGAFAGAGRIARADGQVAALQGLVTIHRLGPVTLHAYRAPEASAAVTTHIVETAGALHIVDAQFLQVFAAEARAYAETLGKPIAAVYLSHAHPDHLLGAPQFAGAPFLTSANVRADAEGAAQIYAARKQALGDDTDLILPAGELSLGAQDWDGVAVEIAEVADAESPHALTFHLPEAGLMIAQDLLYASAHAYPLGDVPNWIAALEAIRATEGLRVVAAGHGLPAAPGALTDAIGYLTLQQQVLAEADTAEAAVAALKAAYPGYSAERLLGFVGRRFQP